MDDMSGVFDDLLTQAAQQFQKPINIPTFGGVSTKGVKTEVDRAKQSRDALDKTIGSSQDLLISATAKEKDAIQAEGEAKAQGEYANADRAKQIADTHTYFNKLFGVEADPSEAISVLAKAQTELEPQVAQQAKEIHDMQAVGPLDNPLEWLVNGLQLPSKIQAYNSNVTEVQNLQDAIESGIQNANTAGEQATKGIPTVTAAQAKAKADQAKAEANKLSAAADDNLARTSVTFAQAKLAGDMSIADATIKTSSLDLENAKMQYQSQINAINLADTHAQRLETAAKFYEQISTLKAGDSVISNADKILGYQPGTHNRTNIKFMTQADRDNFIAIGASGSFGSNPVDAFVSIKKARTGPVISEDTTKLVTYLNDKLTTSNNTASGMLTNGKLLPEQKEAAVKTMVNTAIKADMETASKPGNIFHEMSPATMIASGQIPATSRIGQILKPIATGETPADPAVIANTLMAGIDNDSNAGLALADYYQKNMELRNKSMAFGSFGIIPSDEYKVPVGGMFGSMRLDLTKSGDATKYITYLRLKQRVSQARNQGTEDMLREEQM